MNNYDKVMNGKFVEEIASKLVEVLLFDDRRIQKYDDDIILYF